MKKIVQMLHNLIRKEMKPDGKMGENKPDSDIFHAADSIKSNDAPQDEFAGQVVERKIFEKIVNESLNDGKKHGCLLVCDVDRCREINNIYGYDTGDAVLRCVADVLRSVFGSDARIGSLGGDVFTMWLKALSRENANDIRMQVGVVNDRLLHPVGELPPVSVSVGVSFYNEDDDCKNLIKRAKKALYLVKESGRCGCEMSL